jgi:S-DNA-T family DNA segregation ATPase FtsK/SpoIIIE
MRSGVSAPLAFTDQQFGIRAFARRQVGRTIGLGLFAAVGFAVASLGTWNVADPSFSHATDNPVTNAMGFPGAVFSDLAIQFYGLSSVAAVAPAVIWAILFATARGVDRKARRAGAWFAASLLFAAIAGCVTPPPTWPLPTGLGGVFGDMVLKLPSLALGGYPQGWIAMVVACVIASPAFVLAAYGSGLLFRRHGFAVAEERPVHDVPEAEDPAFEDDEGGGLLALGAITHWWLSARAFVRRRMAMRHADDYGEDLQSSGGWRRAAERVDFAEKVEARVSAGGRARVEPEIFAAMVADSRSATAPSIDDDDMFEDDDSGIASVQPAHRPATAQVQSFRSPAGARVENPAPRPAPGARIQREAQTSLIRPDTFEMPSLHFLSEPKSVARDPSLSKEALEQNARMLEGVLEDFGV